MRINTESTVPVYLQVAAAIKKDIREETLKPGDMLPSDRVYCEELGVSHMTVKKAVDILVNEGIVVRKKGSARLRRAEDHPVAVHPCPDSPGQQGGRKACAQPGSQICKRRSLSAVAKKLGISPGDSVVNLKRLRMINDEIVALENAYINGGEERYQELVKHDFESESLYQVLSEKCGVKLQMAKETIEVSSATEEINRKMGVGIGKPMFYLSRISYDISEEPVEYVESAYRADKYIFSAVLITP